MKILLISPFFSPDVGGVETMLSNFCNFLTSQKYTVVVITYNPLIVKEKAKFREKIKSADGILFAVNEHNYSVSSVLKNVIEWGSRPYAAAVMNKKPVAMFSASNGMLGGARAQYHLRQICVQVDMYPLNKPEVIITFAQDKFDQKGNLTDVHTQEKLKELIDAFIPWVKNSRRAGGL